MSLVSESGLDNRTHMLPKKSDGEPYRFFLVDDSDFMLNNLKRIVTGFGGEIAGVALNGLEAIESYKGLAEKPDLITMDLTMPKMGGLDAIQAIKAENPAQKIVVVSALGQQGVIQQALMLGASHFIVKPFKRDDVFRIFGIVLVAATPTAEAAS